MADLVGSRGTRFLLRLLVENDGEWTNYDKIWIDIGAVA